MRLIDADALKEKLGEGPVSRLDDPVTTQAIYDWREFMTLINDAPTVRGWVSVKDRLPDETEDVIICYEWTGFSGTKYREVTVNDLREVKQISDRIIAWMPFPEPPKEDDNE